MIHTVLARLIGANKGTVKTFLSEELLVDKQAGNGQKQIDKEVTEIIKTHISSYKCRESYYSCEKCLPPELHIEKNVEGVVDCTNFKYSLPKYNAIFECNFNLHFANSHFSFK